jgi:hypothetical protein
VDSRNKKNIYSLVAAFTVLTLVMVAFSSLSHYESPNNNNTPSPTNQTTRIITPHPSSQQLQTPSSKPTKNTQPQATNSENPIISVGTPLSISSTADTFSIVTNLDWGILFPGEFSEKNIYVNNLLSIPVMISVETRLMQPATAVEYLNFSWTMDNSLRVIEGDSQANVTLRVTVAPFIQNITGFNFQIIVRSTIY